MFNKKRVNKPKINAPSEKPNVYFTLMSETVVFKCDHTEKATFRLSRISSEKVALELELKTFVKIDNYHIRSLLRLPGESLFLPLAPSESISYGSR